VRPGGVLLALGATTLLTGAILAWNAVRQERQFRVLLAAGDTALARDETVDAVEAFSGALGLKGDSMVAHLKRGDSYRRRGELAAALRDLREAARLDDTAPRPAELLGDVNVALGRYERGVEDYRRFVSLDDRQPRVWYKLGLALYQDGHAAQAVDPLRRAVGLDDRLAEGHYLLGVCLRLNDRNDEALKSLHPGITSGVYDVLSPQASVASRMSYGGTAPAQATSTTCPARALARTIHETGTNRAGAS